MQRKGLTHDMVAHLWANHATEGGMVEGFNMFADETSIWSYGHHFEIARHVTNEQGERAILITNDSYSVSTAKHIGKVCRAINYGHDTPTFTCELSRDVQPLDVWWDYDAQIAEQMKFSRGAHYDQVNARVSDAQRFAHLNRAQELCDTANKLRNFFALKVKPQSLLKSDREWVEKHTYARRWNGVVADCVNMINEQADTYKWEVGGDLKRWRNGENIHPPQSLRNRIYLRRINRPAIKEDIIQTSWGATFPTEQAIAAWPIIRRCFQRGETFIRNGSQVRLGQFQIDAIKANGDVEAGCHNVSFDEIKRLAEELNLETI